MMRIPIPDAWKMPHPQLIAPAKYLRRAYLFIFFAAILTFVVSCIYYREFDTYEISKITPSVENNRECKSFGIIDNISLYECTKIIKKSLWSVISLSWASSQLVTVILLIIFGIIFEKTFDPVQEQSDKTQNQMSKQIELHQIDSKPDHAVLDIEEKPVDIKQE